MTLEKSAGDGGGAAPMAPSDDGLGPSWKFWRRQRYIVALLAFFGFFNVYALRVNLSVAIVSMTDVRTVVINNTVNGTVNTTVIEVQDFDWDSKTQGLLLSSFFWGYIVTQLPGGWLAARYGGNRVYGIGLVATALLTLLTPPIANLGSTALIIVRIIEGIFEGVTYPCIHAVWARWAPPQERSRLATFAFSGSYVGTVVAMPVCGVLAYSVGWPSIFYVFGTIGVLWFVAWTVLVYEGPDHDPRITSSELQYIRKSLGNTVHDKDIVHPWKSFLTSMPVWSIVCAHFCENWGFYTLLTQLPTFMSQTFGFKLKDSGFLSALPYLAMTIILQGAGQLADFLINRKILNTTMVRKAFNCVAFVAQTVFMMLAGHLNTAAGIVTCLTLAVGIGAFAWSGFSVNHLDIAPQHASVLMGLSNTFATLPGIISPALTGYIVNGKEGWSTVFYIASAIYLGGAIFYGVFASGERQKWALDPPPAGPPPTSAAAPAPTPDQGTGKSKAEDFAYVNSAIEVEEA